MTVLNASRAAGLGLISTLFVASGPATAGPPAGSVPPPWHTAADSLRWRFAGLDRRGVAPTRAAADSLTALIVGDPDREVRIQALQGIRLLASTIVRKGVVDVPRDPQFAPLVEGLVPVLVEAAADTDRRVVHMALFALADAKGPEAQEALRAHLTDPDPESRFTAACLLTEFGDDAGMEELGKALDRLTGPDAKPGARYDIDAEPLLASLTRITGVSLGPIPPNPMVSSSMVIGQERRDAYGELLRAWAQWWTENPPTRR